MRTFIFIACLFLSALTVEAQPDPGRWFVPDTMWATSYCYKAKNVQSGGGLLTLTAISDNPNCNGTTYSRSTGAVLTSPSFRTYGTYVVRAKAAPSGGHTAIWMTGGEGAAYPPTCIAAYKAGGTLGGACSDPTNLMNEIDLAEVMPGVNGLSVVSNSVHFWLNNINQDSTYGGSTKNYNCGCDLSAAYHDYGLIWTPTLLTFTLDGVTTNTFALSVDAPMLLYLDLELDGTAGAGTYPLSMYAQAVNIWNPSGGLEFSDYFASSGGFWFGIP